MNVASFAMLGLAIVLNQRALRLTMRMGPEFYEANPMARPLLERPRLRIAVYLAVYAWLGCVTWLLAPLSFPFDLLMPALALAVWAFDWLHDERLSREASKL